jgi:hypothetical protein
VPQNFAKGNEQNFDEILQNFGDEISQKWMNKILMKFCEISQKFGEKIFDEISQKKMNEILQNFCDDISQN